jgi:hypothetical protein
MNKEQAVRELLAADHQNVKVSIPAAFYERLVAAGRRRYGTLPKGEVAEKAFLYAAANGLIVWEGELGKRLRAPKKPKAVPKK